MTDHAAYRGTYTDAHGREDIIITNDGTTLTTNIRGVELSGSDFDSFRPANGTTESALNKFVLYGGRDLCACTITAEIPLPVIVHDQIVAGLLLMQLRLGPPRIEANRGIDSEELQLTLKYNDYLLVSSERYGYFEDALNDIQGQMPQHHSIKSCINCLYSDYSVAGNGLYGCMMCFRNIKDQYLKVKTKDDYIDIEIEALHERWVQETYLCPDFTVRIKGTGYRG